MFSPILAIGVLVAYFALLLIISYLTREENNSAFFLGHRDSPWWVVAIGMIGASISGISVVSVPGMVSYAQFTYMPTVIGFFFGYLVVAMVLLPLYYRHNLTTIYGYLEERFGEHTHRTGAWLFIVAKIVGAATKLYVVVLVLQSFVFSAWNVPFGITAAVCVVMIWLYTRKGGIKTIVWTDLLQTICMLLAIVLMSIEMFKLLDVNVSQAWQLMSEGGYNHTIEWNWQSPRNVVKQFVSGIFIVIVMTGLDQDMMQKNLSCRNLKESKRNMLCYGSAFIPVNFMLLMLGALMLIYANSHNMSFAKPDMIVPFFASSVLGKLAAVCFLIGIVAASFSSADSALTSITTTFCVDVLNIERRKEKDATYLRKWIHLAVCVVFVITVILFGAVEQKSIIDLIFTIVSYAYGPLLGLFIFALFTKKMVRDYRVPFVAIASPVVTYLIQFFVAKYTSYTFGYELLLLNGMLTFVGLLVFCRPQSS